MLELARRLLTAPLRPLLRFFRGRLGWPRKKQRPSAGPTPRATPTLKLEPFENRAQVGNRLEWAVLGLGGLGVAVLSEPIQAMVRAVGQEPLLTPVFPNPASVAGEGAADTGGVAVSGPSSGTESIAFPPGGLS
jgi:hypothetical protein